jgi:hypothetical protein
LSGGLEASPEAWKSLFKKVKKYLAHAECKKNPFHIKTKSWVRIQNLKKKPGYAFFDNNTKENNTLTVPKASSNSFSWSSVIFMSLSSL